MRRCAAGVALAVLVLSGFGGALVWAQTPASSPSTPRPHGPPGPTTPRTPATGRSRSAPAGAARRPRAPPPPRSACARQAPPSSRSSTSLVVDNTIAGRPGNTTPTDSPSTGATGQVEGATVNDGLIWPHCDGLVWPHLVRPTADDLALNGAGSEAVRRWVQEWSCSSRSAGITTTVTVSGSGRWRRSTGSTAGRCARRCSRRCRRRASGRRGGRPRSWVSSTG